MLRSSGKRWTITKFLTQLRGGPPWDIVVWREIVDLDAGIILEDKPKETITKRDLTNTLGKKMNLKITLYTDVDSQPTQSPDPGEFHTMAEDVIDESYNYVIDELSS